MISRLGPFIASNITKRRRIGIGGLSSQAPRERIDIAKIITGYAETIAIRENCPEEETRKLISIPTSIKPASYSPPHITVRGDFPGRDPGSLSVNPVMGVSMLLKNNMSQFSRIKMRYTIPGMLAAKVRYA
jgi:hypothetical protein